MKKINRKNCETVGFAVGYVVTRFFKDECHRLPTEEEIKEIEQKCQKYLLELLDKIK
jgi:uncharacterized membrane-anchored protein YhcB (DUF1043 family)